MKVPKTISTKPRYGIKTNLDSEALKKYKREAAKKVGAKVKEMMKKRKK